MCSGVGGIVEVFWRKVVVILVLLIVGVKAKEGGKGNFSSSPTNLEEVMARNKDTFKASASASSDDFWVGSNKLEFKPHPLLMPVTELPSSGSIPIPIIELGSPPTTVSTFGEEESEDEVKREVPQVRNRDRRKNTRDQRRLVHRTLWAMNETGPTPSYIVKAVESHPPQHHMMVQQPQQQPVILTGAGGGQTSLFLSTRNDESFHGGGSMWNLNHQGNQLGALQMQQHHQQPQIIQQVQFPPQQHQQSHTIQQVQFPPQQQHFIQQQLHHYPMPSAPEAEMIMQQQYTHQTTAPTAPSPASSSNGPILVYVPPSMNQGTHAPVPLKIPSFSMNEIPMDLTPVKPIYRGPEMHSHSHSHEPNPQYFRNNLLRVVMDKLAFVGKSIPIPFVTKYSSHASHSHGHHNHHQQHQGYSRQNFARRMR